MPVAPTERGRVLFGRLTGRIKALNHSGWSGFTDDELHELTRLLNKAWVTSDR